MGAGASTDQERNRELRRQEEVGHGQRFFCHECRRSFITHTRRRATELQCNFCRSTFLEEIEGSILSRPRPFEFNEDQTRRLTTAAALLHMLESQLRDELEMLQSTISMSSTHAKVMPFTQGMKDMLKNVKVSAEMVCEQPSCPICSEDYVEHEDVMKLPCTHYFHKDCVMPWLENKRTCPICRFEIKHTVLSCSDLEKLSREELKYRISARVELDEDIEKESTSELAVRLHYFLKEEQEEVDDANASNLHEGSQDGRMVINTFRRQYGGDSISAIIRRQQRSQQLRVRRAPWSRADSDDEDNHDEDSRVGHSDDDLTEDFSESDHHHGHHGLLSLRTSAPRVTISTSNNGETLTVQRSGGNASHPFGSSAVGSSAHNSVVYRSPSSEDNASLLTEMSSSSSSASPRAVDAPSFRFVTSTRLSSRLSNRTPVPASSHSPSQRLIASGQMALGSHESSSPSPNSSDTSSRSSRHSLLVRAQSMSTETPSSFTPSTFIIRSNSSAESPSVVRVPVVNPPPEVS